MPYQSLQFVGYSIDTAPRENNNGSETYLGLPNPQHDIEARCKLMLRAMQTAQVNLPQASPPEAPGTTLKVFMAPEFMFRGATGAYQMDDVQLAIETLQQLAADDQWADWIFAFGTILGVSLQHLPDPPFDIDFAATKEIYNFLLVQEGGLDSQGKTGAHAVMKELKSNIDFIAGVANPGGLLFGEVEPLAPAAGGGPGREQQRLSYDGAGIFPMRGVTWAADICLDHLEQRLQRSPQLPNAAEVQVQLVPSCGADIDEAGVVALSGGYVFNVDGHNGSHADLQRVEVPMEIIDPLQQVAVDDSDIELMDTSPVQQVAVDQLYRDGAGTIVIFGALPIPAAGNVDGTCTPLQWQASADYQFRFDLVYDGDGDIRTVLCEVVSRKIDFHGNKYFLPFKLETKDKQGNAVHISIEEGPGSEGYDKAVWCRIDEPGFDFEGNAFLYNDSLSIDGLPRPAPMTIW